MHPNWPAVLIAIAGAGVLVIIAWTRNETPEFQRRLTATLAMIIAILIAAIFWMAE
jgi:hypothetical protein